MIVIPLGLGDEDETTYIWSVQDFSAMIAFNGLVRGWPCTRQSGKHVRDPTHDYSTAGERPHSNLRGFQESLHTIKLSAELFGIVLMTKVATSGLIKSISHLIGKEGQRRDGRV